jgi:sigma-B regulation protein RsbU (phosphoserine phosphatase)
MVTMAPASVLEKVNHQICLSNGEDMFVTAWLGVLEISTGTIKAANAGHEYPAVCIGSNHFELLHDKHGFVLGGMDGMRYNEYEIRLNAGDTLFLYTDGVPETTGPDTAMFGTGRMLKALDETRGSSAKDMLKHLSKVLEEFKGENDQFDDLTMLAINYKGNGGKKKTFEAVTANLPAVLEFIDSELEAAGCGMKQQLQIDVSVEELFVNICNYAYAPETGNVVIGVKVTDDPKTAEVTFADTGMPYDPFARKDPDITLPAEQREIGGLGVLMVRKSMDETYYEYTDGQNKVTIRKAI